MTSGESLNPDIPPDQLAPNLDLLWYPDEAKREHYSSLTPDPEAQIDMRTWARLFSQIHALDIYDEGEVTARHGDQYLVFDYPIYGYSNPDTGRQITSVSVSMNESVMDGDKVIGQKGLACEMDLLRPGYVTYRAGIITHPEKVLENQSFDILTPKYDSDIGIYLSSKSSSVGYRYSEVSVMDQAAAEALSARLAEVSVIDMDSYNNRFNQNLDHMDEAVAEAVHRYYVLGKKLDTAPEEAFKPSQWWWSDLPSQRSMSYNMGIVAEHHDKVEAIAPPGGIPSDGQNVYEAYEQMEKGSGNWLKATWIKEQLPDDIDYMFVDPTEVGELTPKQVIAESPDEMKQEIANWARSRLADRRSWIDMTIGNLESVVAMSEAEFTEKKQAAQDGTAHFRWQYFPSLRSVLVETLKGPLEYDAWAARYDKMAASYRARYQTYAEVIENFPHERLHVTPTLWRDDNERDQIYAAARKAIARLETLPPDPPPEPVDFDSDIELI